MKLYFSPGSCSLAVRIVINEIGLPCEYEAVNLATKKLENAQDYFRINTKGAVPALLINEHELLTENTVIQQYLADTHPESKLLPSVGDFQRYRVLEWLNFIATDLHKACSPLFTPAVPAEVKANVFKPALQSKLAYVEHTLGNKSYLLVDHFTLPDAYLFVVLSWMSYLQVDMKEYPNLTRYFDALSKRPSIAKSLADDKKV